LVDGDAESHPHPPYGSAHPVRRGAPRRLIVGPLFLPSLPSSPGTRPGFATCRPRLALAGSTPPRPTTGVNPRLAVLELSTWRAAPAGSPAGWTPLADRHHGGGRPLPAARKPCSRSPAAPGRHIPRFAGLNRAGSFPAAASGFVRVQELGYAVARNSPRSARPLGGGPNGYSRNAGGPYYLAGERSAKSCDAAVRTVGLIGFPPQCLFLARPTRWRRPAIRSGSFHAPGEYKSAAKTVSKNKNRKKDPLQHRRHTENPDQPSAGESLRRPR